MSEKINPQIRDSRDYSSPWRVSTRRWERVSMDLITHLPKTKRGYDSLFVIVDYCTKMIVL